MEEKPGVSDKPREGVRTVLLVKLINFYFSLLPFFCDSEILDAEKGSYDYLLAISFLNTHKGTT